MGSQTSIATGVIGVLLILFVGILYSRFGGEQPPLSIPVPTPVPVQDTKDSSLPSQGKRPTIVQKNPNTLPEDAFNPLPGLPHGTPQVGPRPELLLPPEARTPFEGILAPGDVEADRGPSWPIPSPTESREFLLPPLK